MTEEEFALLAAGAALGALSAADRQTYDRALAEHPEWDALAAEDTATAAALAELVDEVAPRAALRASILARIEDVPAGADAGVGVGTSPEGTSTGRRASAEDASSGRGIHSPASRTPHRRWGRRGWLALAASLVLVAGIGVGTTIAVQQVTRPASVVALNSIEAAPDAQRATAKVVGGGPATLHWSASVGEAVLVTRDMPSLTASETFELWYVRGKTAVPAGTFDAGDGTASTKLQGQLRPGDVVAVTVERAGGSPTGQPTTTPILAIPTA